MEIEVHKNLSDSIQLEWQAFIEHSIYQHPRQDLRFAIVDQKLGGQLYYIIGRKQGVIKVVGIFCFKSHPVFRSFYSEASCFSGPICDTTSDLVAFLQNIRLHSVFSKVAEIKVTPYWTGDAAKDLNYTLLELGWQIPVLESFRRTGLIDLKRESTEILAAFSKSARREVRRAERQGIKAIIVQEEPAAFEFLDSLNRLRLSRGLSPVPYESFLCAVQNIYRFGDIGALVSAYHNDKFIGGLLLHRSKVTAHTPHFTTEPSRLRQLNNLRLAPLLWFRGMTWAKEKGCITLDVEGWRDSSTLHDKKHNIYKYKGEFSPTPVLRAPEYIKPVNWLAYAVVQGDQRVKQLAKSIIPVKKK